MAGAGYKLFNTGDVLTAAQVNTYLQEQVVMVFANAAARTTALSGVLAEGMVTYLKDTDALEIYSGAAWVGYGSGDITAVTTAANSGLAGGATSGAVALTLNTTAKGGLLVGTGSGTASELTVGSNNTVLTADSTTATGLKWASASATSGPAFRAYRSSTNQSFSANTWTKVQLNAESFDTNNCFDSSTNYRFTPTTAGYYQLNAAILHVGGQSCRIAIYKNGSINDQGSYTSVTADGNGGVTVASLVYFNGSTDYVELYVNNTSSSAVYANEQASFFDGVWIRS